VRLIDADALKRELKVCGIIDHYGTQALIKIDNTPTIDAEPVRHGRIIKPKRWGEWSRCNLCDGTVPIVYTYCPHCGAKMDGGDHE
jgi:hypothetical protein